jgi:hypothetical protein
MFAENGNGALKQALAGKAKSNFYFRKIISIYINKSIKLYSRSV